MIGIIEENDNVLCKSSQSNPKYVKTSQSNPKQYPISLKGDETLGKPAIQSVI